jgi:hypothetical protein
MSYPFCSGEIVQVDLSGHVTEISGIMIFIMRGKSEIQAAFEQKINTRGAL